LRWQLAIRRVEYRRAGPKIDQAYINVRRKAVSFRLAAAKFNNSSWPAGRSMGPMADPMMMGVVMTDAVAMWHVGPRGQRDHRGQAYAQRETGNEGLAELTGHGGSPGVGGTHVIVPQ